MSAVIPICTLRHGHKILLLSTCEFVMVLNKRQLLLLTAQILLEFVRQNNLLIIILQLVCLLGFRPPGPPSGRKFVPMISPVRTQLNLWLTQMLINFVCKNKIWPSADWPFVRERCASEAGRRNLWCLSGPAESLFHWYRPSARGSTYDWHSCWSILSVKTKIWPSVIGPKWEAKNMQAPYLAT